MGASLNEENRATTQTKIREDFFEIVFHRSFLQSFEFTRAPPQKTAMASPSVDFLVTKDPEANSKGVPSAIFIVRIRISLAGISCTN